jgi:hypothetical protein
VAEVRTVPGCTLEGSREIKSRAAVGCCEGGVAVRVAVRVTPLYVAEMTAVEVVVTARVGMRAKKLFTPEGTVIVAGTVTTAGLLLDNTTVAPPVGAGAVSVTVDAAVPPPCRLAGLRLREVSAAAPAGAGLGPWV